MTRLDMLFALLGDEITEAALVGLVASIVAQPVWLLEESLLGCNGYCVQLSDGVVIGVDPTLTTLGRANTIGHEVAHLLLGHVAPCTVTFQTWRMAAMHDRALGRQRVGIYGDAIEADAEAAGRRIGQCVYNSTRQIPLGLRRKQ